MGSGGGVGEEGSPREKLLKWWLRQGWKLEKQKQMDSSYIFKVETIRIGRGLNVGLQGETRVTPGVLAE